MERCQNIEDGCRKIFNILENEHEPPLEYKRMSMRVMETPENLDEFKFFLEKLQELGFIKIITCSNNYTNRGLSKEERIYCTIEFLKQ